MGGIWFFGFLAVVVYRVFDAGMHTTSLFYTLRSRGYREAETLEYDTDKVSKYILSTVGISIFWYLVLPGYTIFLIGQKFRKEVK